MEKYSFKNSDGTRASSVVANLTAGAALADVAFFDVRHYSKLTITTAVAVAQLTNYVIYGRGDDGAQWGEIIRTEMEGYGCSDTTTDIGRTVVGQSAIVNLDTSFLSQVKVAATSAGNAVLTTTAGAE